MYTLETSLEIPMAHALDSAYQGLCVGNVLQDGTALDLSKRILPVVHGHNNIITIKLKSNYLNNDGMVMDFKKAKEIIRRHFDKYDHSLVLRSNSSLASLYRDNFKEHFIPLYKTRVHVIDDNPTSEVLSTYWSYELGAYFNFYGMDVEVSFEETSHNKCTFVKEENDDPVVIYIYKDPSGKYSINCDCVSVILNVGDRKREIDEGADITILSTKVKNGAEEVKYWRNYYGL